MRTLPHGPRPAPVPLLLTLGLFLMAGTIPAHAQAPAGERLQLYGTTMGSSAWNVIVYADEARREELQQLCQSILDDIDGRMSTYKPESEVSRFNASQSTDWFEVSEQTARVVRRSLEISAECDGAFDITVAPLVNLWKFGPDKSEFRVPDDAAIEAARKLTGFRNLECRTDPPALKKSIPGLQIDLSAIAQGFAVDQIAERLDELGLKNYLVEVSGEMRASGRKPDGEPWVAGIEKPVAGPRAVHAAIPLENQSLATSGGYRNFHEVNGKRYSHTIDPVAGAPVQGAPLSASVIAGDCMTADALATAAIVLGPGGIELGLEFGAEVLLLMPAAGEGEVVERRSEGFPQAISLEELEKPAASPWRMILVAFIIFAVAVAAMSIGVAMGRGRIRGSCGGAALLDDPNADPRCSICSNPAEECRELKEEIRKRQQKT